MQRWIIHIDMDAFFASVEQREHPEFQGKPVIVGGLSKRGVVATASYEARSFGIHSAMPMIEARRLCSDGIFLVCDHEKYHQVSKQIMGILSEYSPLVEPLSLDEAFLDVTGMGLLFSSPRQIAVEIKARIKQELGLIASAGVATNKLLAKLASDLQKPDGLVVVPPGKERQLLADLPIRKLWGIGRTGAKVLQNMGIYKISELAMADTQLLIKQLGPAARELQQLACGKDHRLVIPGQEPKSLGNEMTFDEDLHAWEEIYPYFLALATKIGWRLRQAEYSGRTISIKIKFSSFRTITRSQTLALETNLDEEIYETAVNLCRKVNLTEGVRLVGISLTHLQQGIQTSLFTDDVNAKRNAVLQAVDSLKAKFGENIITRGTLLDKK